MKPSEPTLPARSVVSTYRVQLNRDFGFRRVTRIIPYLHRLGISHLYASPIFAAQPRSTHGYDVIDPTRLNPELGSHDDFKHLIETLHQHDMGLIIDIVSNHQAISELNSSWMSVLELGQASTFADTFDIDWERGDGQVVLPILGRPLNEALQAGEITLVREGGRSEIRYYDHRLPVSPGSRERFATAIEQGTVDQKQLSELLDLQHYRLIFWREAAEQLNYRRFFDINDLIGVRVEVPAVFESTHQFIFELMGSGKIDGLRIDHVDGLADPRRYLQQLEDRVRGLVYPNHCYTVVEKILGRDEDLDRDWPVDGTTGYDFLRVVNDLFVDTDGLRRLERDYATRIGSAEDFASTAYRAKRQIIASLFTGDTGNLAGLLQQIAEQLPEFSDLTESDIRDALIEVTCRLDVYRTYCYRGGMPDGDRRRVNRAVAEAQGRPEIDLRALAFVRRALTFELPRTQGSAGLDLTSICQPVVSRWQQLSGAVMAKSVEDTAFYRYCPLLSLNDVGSDPNVSSDPIRAFHDWNLRMASRWPRTMTTTSTHDTKRGEDARARLDVLSELSDEWNDATTRWSWLNGELKHDVDGHPTPDIQDELLIYQTLVAVWPPDVLLTDELRERLHTYLTKALREGKRRTSWRDPNDAYERAAHEFLSAILDPDRGREFIDDFSQFVERLSSVGAINALSQLLLKLTAVGVPDTYQGAEGWDLSLADPDNRRPVDFDGNLHLLNALAHLDRHHHELVNEVQSLLIYWHDGGIKLYLLSRVLGFRRRQPALFLDGDYLPLRAEGPRSNHVIAFARRSGNGWSMTIAPRLLAQLAQQSTTFTDPIVWSHTTLALPEGAPKVWRDVLTGATIQAAEMSGNRVLRLKDVFRYTPFVLLAAAE